MAYDKRPGAGAVFRLDPDLSIEPVLDDVTVSNGLEWSPDGTIAYYNDTDTLRTDVFDYDAETGLTNRRAFVAHSPEDGRPDGLTVDSEGGVWIAMNRAGAVRRYGTDGSLDCVLELPVSKVTACTLGGSDLDELFITTSREDLPPDAEPQAGALFRARVEVSGLPVREFAG
jgi:sugar lactone lactonase YvrE